jgi:xanthine dehydrogenase accessory factor
MTTGAAEVVIYDTTSENDLVWGVGLGCHGVVHVLLEKLPPSPAWAVRLRDNLAKDISTTLEVDWRNPDPTLLGTRLKDCAITSGTESAGDVFRDEIGAPTRLAIFGAGDDAQPLCRLAKELGMHVTVADPRPSMATTQRFPDADLCVVAPAAELVSRTQMSASTVSVVMTHHYVHDVPVLGKLLSFSQTYVGLLGPKKRAERILADLAESGCPITDAQRQRLHAPVGLDLGAETPQEVALSIIAEIQAYLSQRDARPLRGRTRPIHSA